MNANWIVCPVCGNKTRDKIREDTITLTLSDYDNGKQYKYSIPFIFSKIDEKMILDN